MDPASIAKLLREIHLVRSPKQLLSTFGNTRIQYHLVSAVDELKDRTRLREGWVVSERPQILTRETLRERFEGFGEDAREFSGWLDLQYRDLLRALEYRFKNTDFTTRVISRNAHDTALSIRADVDAREVARAAVIECPDAAWSLALMRFTLEEAARSFGTNVRDLETRGMFDPAARDDGRRRDEIESLFTRAAASPAFREPLGAKLREYGLFGEYEDRFLALYR